MIWICNWRVVVVVVAFVIGLLLVINGQSCVPIY